VGAEWCSNGRRLCGQFRLWQIYPDSSTTPSRLVAEPRRDRPGTGRLRSRNRRFTASWLIRLRSVRETPPGTAEGAVVSTCPA
jgi:hypothetical protein